MMDMSTGEEDSKKEQKMKKTKKKDEDRESEGMKATPHPDGGVAWRGVASQDCFLSQMAARVAVSVRRCWSDGGSLCSPAPVCPRSDGRKAALRLADIRRASFPVLIVFFPLLRCLSTCPVWSEASSGLALFSTLAAESAGVKETPTTCCCVTAVTAATTPTVCGPALRYNPLVR